jgi:hypothetical protein
MRRGEEIYGHKTTPGVGRITVLMSSYCYSCHFHVQAEENLAGVSDITKIFPIIKQAVN